MTTPQMKSFYFSAPQTMEVLDVDIPNPGYGEVKVKVAYASLCATDVHQVTQGVLGAKPPMALGHETAGTVVGLGEGTEKSGLSLGDKVTAFPVSVCGQCPRCQEGQQQYCVNAAPFGGFSEYYVTGASSVYRLPADAQLTPSIPSRRTWKLRRRALRVARASTSSLKPQVIQRLRNRRWPLQASVAGPCTLPFFRRRTRCRSISTIFTAGKAQSSLSSQAHHSSRAQ